MIINFFILFTYIVFGIASIIFAYGLKKYCSKECRKMKCYNIMIIAGTVLSVTSAVSLLYRILTQKSLFSGYFSLAGLLISAVLYFMFSIIFEPVKR